MNDKTGMTSTTLQIVSFQRLWHVGEMNPSGKRRGSYEGACLSVSRCPGAWREIGEGLVSGPCRVANTSYISFLDAHALDASAKTSILAWGVERGFCKPGTVWTVTTYDDEREEDMTSTFGSRQEALNEIDDDDGIEPKRLDAHRSTAALDAAAMSNGTTLGTANVLDLLLPLWVEENTTLSGVWWADRFGPLAYSAPRGGILASRVSDLEWMPEGSEPYDEHEAGEDEADEDGEDEAHILYNFAPAA